MLCQIWINCRLTAAIRRVAEYKSAMPSRNPLRHVWNSMRQRCSNPNHRQYADYGGRGISVCERWNDFQTFLADMGPRPNGHQIDRIDNDGNYEPSNCRWATRSEQALNRRPLFYYSSNQTRPMRYIRHTSSGYRVSITLKPKYIYEKHLPTIEEAIDLRSDLEFEREMHRKLGLR